MKRAQPPSGLGARFLMPSMIEGLSPEANRALLPILRQLADIAASGQHLHRIDDSLAELGERDASTLIRQATLVARSNQYLRVSPPAAGMALLLPSPKRTAPGDRVTISLEAPAGPLRVACVPNQGEGRQVTLGLVNGAERATFTAAGVIELVSNGDTGWTSATEHPAEAAASIALAELEAAPPGATGATGADGEQGFRGPPGRHGEPGRHGFPGAQGPRGPAGPMPPPGRMGHDGGRGFPGTPGAPGRAGSSGPPGRSGADGGRGRPGAPGQAGASGAAGVAGTAGPPGRRGWPGRRAPIVPGPAGADGAGGGGGLGVVATATVSLGSEPLDGGSFTITGLSGLTTNDPVLVQLAVPVADPTESEEQISISGIVTSATVITCYWQSTDGTPKSGSRLVSYLTASTIAMLLTDGDKGDITVASSGTVWTIDDAAVTNLKLATMPAHTVKVREPGAVGVPTDLEIDVDSFLARVGSGNIISHPFATLAGTGLDYASGVLSLSSDAALPSRRFSWNVDEFELIDTAGAFGTTNLPVNTGQGTWYVRMSGGSAAATAVNSVDGTTDHPGIIAITTNTTDDQGVYMHKGPTDTNSFLTGDTFAGFTWIQKLTTATSVLFRTGLGSDVIGLTGSYILFVFDTDSDTTIHVLNTSGGSITDTDTGVAPGTAWHVYECLHVGSTLEFYIDDVLEATHSTNIPAGAMNFGTFVANRAASTRILQVDYAAWWTEIMGVRF